MLRPEYLAQKLTPYPLPTKDGGVLRLWQVPARGYRRGSGRLRDPRLACLRRVEKEEGRRDPLRVDVEGAGDDAAFCCRWVDGRC